MEYTITGDSSQGIITVTHQGDVTAAVLHEAFLDVSQRLHQHGWTRLLCDYRQATTRLGLAEAFRFPEQALQVTTPLGLDFRAVKRAIVATDHPLRELMTFYETVCSNRGHWVKVFTDMESARAWLMEG